MNKRFLIRAVVVTTVALAAAGGFAVVAAAQSQQTPSGWSYEIRNGQRVPKGNRVVNADGSWREEVRQGNCVTIKEKSAAGDYRETRQCEPRGSN
ncbi:MAG: hypothetical protein ABIR63_05235 [Sphingomicrobium sp.]